MHVKLQLLGWTYSLVIECLTSCVSLWVQSSALEERKVSILTDQGWTPVSLLSSLALRIKPRTLTGYILNQLCIIPHQLLGQISAVCLQSTLLKQTPIMYSMMLCNTPTSGNG